eukprot:COSAG01_NODE_2303_length_7952_cov_4.127849_8_plen_149_part_00
MSESGSAIEARRARRSPPRSPATASGRPPAPTEPQSHCHVGQAWAVSSAAEHADDPSAGVHSAAAVVLDPVRSPLRRAREAAVTERRRGAEAVGGGDGGDGGDDGGGTASSGQEPRGRGQRRRQPWAQESVFTKLTDPEQYTGQPMCP